MIEGIGLNDRLLGCDSQCRDDGTITIGTFLTLINPKPITNFLGNEIPIMEARDPAVVMKLPRRLQQVTIQSSIPQNAARAFVLSGAHIEVLRSEAEQTNCSGLLCDRQRAVEVLKSLKVCGCYAMQNRLSNLVITHTISVLYLRYLSHVHGVLVSLYVERTPYVVLMT